MLIQKELIARNGLVNGTIYLQVTRGSAPRTFNFPKSSPSIVMFTQKRDIVNLPEAKTGIGGLCCKDDRRRWEDGDKLDPISFMRRYRKER
jgi:D-alanine transaminase